MSRLISIDKVDGEYKVNVNVSPTPAPVPQTTNKAWLWEKNNTDVHVYMNIENAEHASTTGLENVLVLVPGVGSQTWYFSYMNKVPLYEYLGYPLSMEIGPDSTGSDLYVICTRESKEGTTRDTVVLHRLSDSGYNNGELELW